jgi:hypothetical protein
MQLLYMVLLLWIGRLPAEQTTGPQSSGGVYDADTVKAAFLYRFTGYVDWPPKALNTPAFTIAVLGDDVIAERLRRLLAERGVKSLPGKVRVIHSLDEVNDAQMLYVGPAYEGSLRALTASLGAQPILTVTDRENGLDRGSVVNFLVVDRHVRFEISLPAAIQARLKIAPDLLSVAVRVRGAPRINVSTCRASLCR